MTGRTLPEWVGAKSDTAIPPRVRDRLFDAAEGKCACCRRLIRSGEPWQADHIVALINGGENREANLQVLCGPCHKLKTQLDVAIKAKAARVRQKDRGIRQAIGRPLPGTRASGWRHRMDGTWERRS